MAPHFRTELTFALGEALYALDAIAGLGEASPPFSDVMENVRLEDPTQWVGHCRGDQETMLRQRHFKYSDQIRYYRPVPSVAAIKDMVAFLEDRAIPQLPLSQYPPCTLADGQAGNIKAPHLVISHVGRVQLRYRRTCQSGRAKPEAQG